MADDDQIWIGQGGQKDGPFSEADLRQRIEEGKLSPDTLAWRKGKTEWKPLDALLGAAEVEEQQLPPPPPPFGSSPSRAFDVGGHVNSGVRPESGNAIDAGYLKDTINLTTLKFVLLSVFTGGIYTLLWLYRYYKVIDTTTKTKNATDGYVIWMAWLLCCVIGMRGYTNGIQISEGPWVEVAVIGFMFSIAYVVMLLIWAFKVKSALENYVLNELRIYFKMNGFYTFIFNVFYISYCINDLPDAQRRTQYIRSSTF